MVASLMPRCIDCSIRRRVDNIFHSFYIGCHWSSSSRRLRSWSDLNVSNRWHIWHDNPDSILRETEWHLLIKLQNTYQHVFSLFHSGQLEHEISRVRLRRRAIENASYTLCDRRECVTIEVKIHPMQANEYTPLLFFRLIPSSLFTADNCLMTMLNLPFIKKEEQKRQTGWQCIQAHEDCRSAALKIFIESS